jgi:hypothetical protein
MIENTGDFDEETLVVSKLNDLGIGYSTAQDGKISLLEKPISKALKTALEREITEQEAQLAEMEKKIASGELKLSDSFEQSAKDQPLNFDTCSAQNMDKMFLNAINFNQPLNFDTSNLITYDEMFAGINYSHFICFKIKNNRYYEMNSDMQIALNNNEYNDSI